MFVICPKCFSKYQIPAEIHLPEGKQVKCSHCQHVFVLAAENVEQTNVPMPEASTNVEALSDAQESPQVVNIDPEPAVFADEQTVFKTEDSSNIPEAFAPAEEEAVLPEPEPRRTFKIHGFIVGILVLMAVAALLFLGLHHADFLKMDWMGINQEESVTMKEEVAPIPVPSIIKTEPVLESNQSIDEPKPQVLPEIHSVRFEMQPASEETVRIEGVLKNQTAQDITLPRTVHAVAYGADGKVLFEKEIYLSDKVLPAGEERNFFGSYAPVQASIQWVEVTF